MNARAAGRVLGLVLAALAATAAPASAQPGAGPHAGGATPAVEDVPGGEGRIAGRVVHPEDPERAAGVDVVLYAISPDGRPGVRRGLSGPGGGFAFEGVSTDPGVAYLVGARYAGVPFVGERIAFAPGSREQEAEVRIAERTRDPAAISVAEATLRVERMGDELLVAEVHRLRNPGERVFFVEPDERGAGAAPGFATRLPEGVVRFGLPYAVAPEGLEHRGRDVRFWGPVYPGTQEVAFTYALPASGEDASLRRRLLSGAEELSVLTPEGGGLDVRSASLTDGGTSEIGGVAYRVLGARDLAPGARIELALHFPAVRVEPDALSLEQARAFLEVDDAATLVTEEYHLQVAGEGPVAAPGDDALLRIPLPDGARDVRYGAEGFASGVTFEDDHLVVRGPVPAGASRLDVGYRLPADGGRRAWTRRFEAAVPVLSVYVADTGLSVETERLHRRRPVRTTGERIYLHFEGFRVEPGEEVALAISPLQRRAPASGRARAAFVLLAALGVGSFLVGPLWRGRAERLEPGDGEASAARRERESLYAAIRDLDHDHETGKVTDEDHAAMRAELRRRAVALMHAERRAAARAEERRVPAAGGAEGGADSGADAGAAGEACPACGALPPEGARFCPQCGASLVARDPAARDPSGARG